MFSNTLSFLSSRSVNDSFLSARSVNDQVDIAGGKEAEGVNTTSKTHGIFPLIYQNVKKSMQYFSVYFE